MEEGKVTYRGRKLRACKTCGIMPVVERWESGGSMYAVRCNNPNRPDSCDQGFYCSMYRKLDEAIAKWNDYQCGEEA